MQCPSVLSVWMLSQNGNSTQREFTDAGRVSNPVFTETEKPGNPKFFQNRVFSKPKNRFLAACKPGFSVFNFDLQMSHYATILTQTAYNVHDSMFLFVYIYHWRPGSAGFTLHSSKSFIDIALLLLTRSAGMCIPAVDRGLDSHH